ncbi:sorting nexin-30-like isoform X2 [Daktulosphaira vitifoliae]|uniref:sorting nexin-30-like isoform X2 n=1 Tax=Daktulosphaira vitifoliae TaxID=58002 RepID=UPI0021AB06A7|nr:sorting nexin-30-like isoform X2 [Daktulosphaira vitifoliae]
MMEDQNSAVLEVSVEEKGVSSMSPTALNDTPIINYPSFTNDSFHKLELKHDIQVRVENPQKIVEPLETYITYRVTTKVDHPDYQDKEYVIRRRYNDFIWLRQNMTVEYQDRIIPPLPAKHTILGQLDRYSKEFVSCRMNLLERFLARLVCHPIFSEDRHLRVFLTANATEFTAYKKRGSSLLRRMSNSLNTIANSYSSRQIDYEFDPIRNHLQGLSEKLTMLEKVAQRIHKERKELCVESHQLGAAFIEWSSNEQSISVALSRIGHTITANSSALRQNLINNFQNDWAQPLKDYVNYIECVRETLTKRDALQLQYEQSVLELEKKKADKDKVASDEKSLMSFWTKSETNKEEKIEKITQIIPKLVSISEAHKEQLDASSNVFKEEYAFWKNQKKADFKKMLTTLAESHIQYYQHCTTSWDLVFKRMSSE